MSIAIQLILLSFTIPVAVEAISFPDVLLDKFHESQGMITSLEVETRLLSEEMRSLNCRIGVLELCHSKWSFGDPLSLADLPEGCSVMEALLSITEAKIRLGTNDGSGARPRLEWLERLKLKAAETSAELDDVRARLQAEHASISPIACQLTDSLQQFARQKQAEFEELEDRLQNMREYREDLLGRAESLRSIVDLYFEVVPGKGGADQFALQASWVLMEEGKNTFDTIPTPKIISQVALDGMFQVPNFLISLIDTEITLTSERYAALGEEIARAENSLTDVTQFFL